MEEYQTLVEKEQGPFIYEGRITNEKELESVINHLKSLKLKAKKHHCLFSFRGVSEARYKMFNSLQRSWQQNNLEATGIDPIEAVQNLLNICNNTEPILKKLLTRLGVMYNDWWLLSFLQHYGASSPLLDFSRNHEVALFFACKDMDEETSKNDINNYCSIYYYDYKEGMPGYHSYYQKTC